MTRAEKVARFRALHVPGDPLVMPNPWDMGSARVMAALGAKALATTSSGFAFTLGLPDGAKISCEDMLDHARDLSALDLPVNGDLENGYGDDPETVAETVRLAAEAGLAGVSIEDTVFPDTTAYGFDLALDRVRAAIEAAREVDIVLTARADGYLMGGYDEAEAVRRLRAFAEAGAEVLYAPRISAETTRTLAAEGMVLNTLAVGDMLGLGVAGIADLGAARISAGGTIARNVHRVIIERTKSMLAGDLGALTDIATAREVDALLTG